MLVEQQERAGGDYVPVLKKGIRDVDDVESCDFFVDPSAQDHMGSSGHGTIDTRQCATGQFSIPMMTPW